MKGLSFWQWLGLVIIIMVIGGVIFRLIYGKSILAAVSKMTGAPEQAPAGYTPAKPIATDNPYAKLSYYGS